MRDGEYITTLNTRGHRPRRDHQRMMVGRAIYEEPKTVSNVPPDAPVVLEVETPRSPRTSRTSPSQLHKGEILGFAGLMGAGRTETARLIFGADPSDGRRHPHRTARNVHITDPRGRGQGRHRLPLRGPQAVRARGWGCPSRTTPVLANARRNSPAPASSTTRKIREAAQEYVEQDQHQDAVCVPAKVAQPLGRQPAEGRSSPSGWSATATSSSSTSPRRGIDVGAKSEIYKLMNRAGRMRASPSS